MRGEYVEKEEHKNNRIHTCCLPVSSCAAVAPALIPSRPVLLSMSVPSRGSAVAVALYFVRRAKEIIVEEEDSKVERRTEDRGQTKEKKQKVTSCPTQLIVVLDGKRDIRKEEE